MVVVVVKCLKCGHTATLKLENVGNAAKVKCTKCKGSGNENNKR